MILSGLTSLTSSYFVIDFVLPHSKLQSTRSTTYVRNVLRFNRCVSAVLGASDCRNAPLVPPLNIVRSLEKHAKQVRGLSRGFRTVVSVTHGPSNYNTWPAEKEEGSKNKGDVKTALARASHSSTLRKSLLNGRVHVLLFSGPWPITP